MSFYTQVLVHHVYTIYAELKKECYQVTCRYNDIFKRKPNVRCGS